MDSRELAQRLDTIQEGINYLITLFQPMQQEKEKKKKVEVSEK